MSRPEWLPTFAGGGGGGADEGRRGLPGIRECPGESWGNLVGAKSPGTVSGCGSSPDPQVVGVRNVSRLPGARGGGGLMSWSGRVMPRGPKSGVLEE